MEREKRPSFRENLLAPIKLAKELRDEGIQRKHLPILAVVGLIEGTLFLLVATSPEQGVLEKALWFGATNLVIHLFVSLSTSSAMPENFIG